MMKDLDFERTILFRDEKTRLTEEHRMYLAAHPEIKHLLADFMVEVLVRQPDDLVKFTHEHFDALLAAKTQTHHPIKLKPVVFMGPSGVGKGTVIKALMAKYPGAFGFSVSHTTRGPRPGERNGVDYHFVKRPVIEEMIHNNEFIEHATVHTNVYGTSKTAMQAVIDQGKMCVLDIDVQGAMQLRKSGVQAINIFIEPPSLADLEQRLRGRGTETEDATLTRLLNAKAEIDSSYQPGFVDFRVVNRDVGKCVDDIAAVLAPQLLILSQQPTSKQQS